MEQDRSGQETLGEAKGGCHSASGDPILLTLRRTGGPGAGVSLGWLIYCLPGPYVK